MSEWISVDERLPRVGQRVLGAVRHPGRSYEYFTQDFLELRSDGEWRNVNESGYRVGERATVTHWMPLPDPPQHT